MEELCVLVGTLQKLTVGKNIASEKGVGWRTSGRHIWETHTKILSAFHIFAYKLQVGVLSQFKK